MNGVVEKLTGNTYFGWVGVGSDVKPDEVSIEAVKGGRVLVQVKPGQKRNDVRQQGVDAYQFRISIPLTEWSDGEATASDITIYAVHGSDRVVIELWKPLKLAQEIAALSFGAKMALRSQLDVASREVLESGGFAFIPERRTKQRFDRCCVITYANDSTGWFPYFFKHYANKHGLPDIYVVTPQPSKFKGFDLAGVIGVEGAGYDDAAICNVVSCVANGLRSYFESVLVCDVDEILEPAARSGFKTLHDYVRQRGLDISASRGVDVIQMPGEAPFDFDKTVLENRGLGILNTAMCKPHLSSIPIRYGEGQHFCSKKALIPVLGEGLISYHLKWACAKIRREILSIVSGIKYEEQHIGAYSVASVSALQHPSLSGPKLPVVEWSDERVANFEQQFNKNILYSNERGVWSSGEHRVSGFLVDLK